MITMPIELYTDGSSLRNPGASGLAYIIRYWDLAEGSDIPEQKIIERNQGFRLSTNNRMEIMAGVWGLRDVIQNVENGTFTGLKQVNLFSDSEYFVKAVNMKWIDKWIQNNWMTSGFQEVNLRLLRIKTYGNSLLKQGINFRQWEFLLQ